MEARKFEGQGILTGKRWAFSKGFQDAGEFARKFNPFRKDTQEFSDWENGWDAKHGLWVEPLPEETE